MMQHTSSLPGAPLPLPPPSLIWKQTILCFLNIYFATCWYCRVPKWRFEAAVEHDEIKFGRFCCLLVLQSFNNAWRLWINVNQQPQILIVKKQQIIVIAPAEALEEVKGMLKFCRKLWCSSPRWWKVSDTLHTNSIDRLCTQPYHYIVRKSWLFLSWLVG